MINFKGFFYFKIFMYICIMLRYKKGDIVICVTNKMYGMTYLLEEGEQYRIDDCIEMAEKNLVSVTNIKNNKDIGIFDDKHFMPLDIWREFQLRKILE